MEQALPFLFTAGIIGLTQLYRALIRRDFEAAGLIFVSGLGGALLAHFETQFGFTLLEGIVHGLGASGAVTLVKSLGTGGGLEPKSLTGEPTS